VSRGKGTGTLVASLVGVLAIFGGVAEAKKGGKAATEEVTNVPIVEGDAPSDRIGVTDVQFRIGKKFKGKSVGKVELTVQITGQPDDYLFNIAFAGSRLISPQGRALSVNAVALDFTGGDPNRTYGPLTVTPDSPKALCFFPPCGANFDDPLGPPWVGSIGQASLNRFYGVRMRGTWTWEVNNFGLLPGSGVVNLARLKVTPAKKIEG
jgi:hypothetical protein